MSTCGEFLVKQLQAWGVDTVFGIPGVHTVELYRGLPGSGIRHITPRHEQGAAFMADGYARASGRVGVAFVITGPGLTNALTAMAQARADSVPMLVVSGGSAHASWWAISPDKLFRKGVCASLWRSSGWGHKATTSGKARANKSSMQGPRRCIW